MKEKEYVVTIAKWKKYQNREIKTRSIWFRMQNDFFDSPNFYAFSSEERLVWLYMLCCASKLNTFSLHVPLQCSHQGFHRSTGIDENVFHHAIEKLKKLQIVEIRTTRGRYAHDTSEILDDTLQDKTRQDKTRQDKDSIAHPRFDFEILYLRYPRKIGKQEGLKKAKTQIRTEEDYQLLSTAIDRYKNYCITQATESKFILHFSTFMGRWRDWLDPAAGSSDVGEKKAYDWDKIFKEGT